MISVSDVSMAFGQKVLFEKISFRLVAGNSYGLIGANGTGKSTFMKIMARELEPTTGQIVLDPGKRFGVLRQDITGHDAKKVIDVCLEGYTEFWAVQKALDDLYAKGDFSDADAAKQAKLQEQLEAMDGYNQESNAAQALQDLGIGAELH